MRAEHTRLLQSTFFNVNDKRSAADDQQRIAMWRAARSGIRGDLISPTKGGPLPAAEVVGELLAHISDALERSGDLEWVRTQLGIVLARGTGADQQRAWRAVGADTGAVVRNAVERTLA